MFTYLSWWYGQEPVILWQATEVITKKIYSSFSVSLLFRTLFDPWKRDIVGTNNPSLREALQILMSNMISRLVGFIIRLFTIFTGLLITMICFLAVLTVLVIWLLVPILTIGLLIHGVSLLANG